MEDCNGKGPDASFGKGLRRVMSSRILSQQFDMTIELPKQQNNSIIQKSL